MTVTSVGAAATPAALGGDAAVAPTLPATGAGAAPRRSWTSAGPAPSTRTTMRRMDDPAVRHRTAEELAAFLPTLQGAPRDVGRLELVVRRPAPAEREVLREGELDLAVGLVGDSWSGRPSSRTEDGRAHPDMQLTIMSSAVIGFLAGDPGRRALAGDQLYVDLDLSHDNLPVGSRLTIGHLPGRGAVVVVTDEPHRGCAKFVHRFGADAMRAVNGTQGRRSRLRGLNARVVVPGRVRPGDPVTVHRPETSEPDRESSTG